MNPLVSIIIPLYNRGNLIIETLDSIKNQTYSNWECIMVDDHSTDNTEEVISDYIKNDKRFVLYKRLDSLPKGANACRNYGFDKSRGELIQWFDSDDVMLSDFLDVKVNSINNIHKKISICELYVSNEKLEIVDHWKFPDVINNLHLDYLKWNIKICTNSVMFKKDFLRSKKLFDLSLHRGQETELFNRLFKGIENNEVGFIRQPLFKYVQHDKSITRNEGRYASSHIKSRFKTESRILVENKMNKDIEVIYIDKLKKHQYQAYIYDDKKLFIELYLFLSNYLKENKRKKDYYLYVMAISLMRKSKIIGKILYRIGY